MGKDWDLPEQVWVLLEMTDPEADMTNMTQEEFLDRVRAHAKEAAGEQPLSIFDFHCESTIPIFSDQESAQAFTKDFYQKGYTKSNPNTNMIAFTLASIAGAKLIEHVRAVPDLYGVLDPSGPNPRRLLPMTERPAPTEIPEILYAITGNHGGLADLTGASADDIRAYLQSQAELSDMTQALTLYACRLDDRNVIPLFSELEDGKRFAGRVADTHLREASVAVLTVVGMNQLALYDRIVKRTDVEAVLDPRRSGGLTIRPEDLPRKTFFGPKPKIVERSMVWSSPKGSDVDRAL